MRRLRQWLCSHPDTSEEWAETHRAPGLFYDTVTRTRTLWRCNRCGKVRRRAVADAAESDSDFGGPTAERGKGTDRG